MGVVPYVNTRGGNTLCPTTTAEVLKSKKRKGGNLMELCAYGQAPFYFSSSYRPSSCGGEMPRPIPPAASAVGVFFFLFTLSCECFYPSLYRRVGVKEAVEFEPEAALLLSIPVV